MSADQHSAPSERQIESWWIQVCPTCGGLVQRAITTHVGDCPRRFTTARIQAECPCTPCGYPTCPCPRQPIDAREEVERLRAAFAEYRLWEPGSRGYAAARRRVEEAFGYADYARLAREGGLAND